jgi:hypothetical protein
MIGRFAMRKPCPLLPPKADMCSALAHVCFVPKADIAEKMIEAAWGLGGLYADKGGHYGG